MSFSRRIAALADPIRTEMLRRLADSPFRAGELAAGLPISRPAAGKLPRSLKRAGLTRATRSGRERIYRVASSGRRKMGEMPERMRAMAHRRGAPFEAFKHYAEKDR